MRVVDVDTDWSFKLQSLGGPFLFRVMGIPDEWTLGAVRLEGKDITDIEYDVPTGGKEIRGLEVVLTRKIGRVSGTVTDTTGKPASQATVVVFSEDADHWRPYSRYVQATRSCERRPLLSQRPAPRHLPGNRPRLHRTGSVGGSSIPRVDAR